MTVLTSVSYGPPRIFTSWRGRAIPSLVIPCVRDRVLRKLSRTILELWGAGRVAEERKEGTKREKIESWPRSGWLGY